MYSIFSRRFKRSSSKYPQRSDGDVQASIISLMVSLTSVFSHNRATEKRSAHTARGRHPGQTREAALIPI